MSSSTFAVLCIALISVQIDAYDSVKFIQPRPFSTVIDDIYFVVFQRNISAEQRSKHMLSMTTRAEVLNGQVKYEVRREYKIGNSFQAYTTKMCSEMIHYILDMPEVRYVTPDTVAKLAQEPSCITQEEASWGLVRTSSRVLNIDGYYEFSEGDDGLGVEAYIIDTGIYAEHNDFEGRALPGVDFVYGNPERPDGNGHGTHVASTIVGRLYGIAKRGTAIGVRVLNDNGSGSFEDVIAGINYVADQARERVNSTVANMSLGGSQNQPLDDAVLAAAEAGVVMVVAAGNENTNACLRSPAASDGAITVGATDNTDTLASFSNQGMCVEIYCPGVGITGAWIGSPSSINTISGTSMASPHVAGIVAKYLTTNPTATPIAVEEWLVNLATKDIVNGLNSESFNRLCFMGCSDAKK
eukprot:m.306025 g.306025  ORF g.306025 m.306025 type:complete len:412 (+) comp40905_c0_seq1:66-1301(+)